MHSLTQKAAIHHNQQLSLQGIHIHMGDANLLTKFNFLRDQVRKGKFEDVFTKPLKFDRFKRPGERLTLVCVWDWIKGEY